MINIAWTILLTAVAMVESGENINAYNQGENAIGLLQIRQPAVDDLNRLWKTSYKLTDTDGSDHPRRAGVSGANRWHSHPDYRR